MANRDSGADRKRVATCIDAEKGTSAFNFEETQIPTQSDAPLTNYGWVTRGQAGRNFEAFSLNLVSAFPTRLCLNIRTIVKIEVTSLLIIEIWNVDKVRMAM